MEVTLHPVEDQYNESVISVRIDSDRVSLLEPEIGEFGPQPSAADKLIVLAKKALTESGMTVIENQGKGGYTSATNSPQDKIKLSLREFSSYKPGGDGVRVRAEQGYYNGKFNMEAMMDEAGAVLNELGDRLRDARTIKAFEDRLNRIFDAVDLHEKSLEEALAAPRPAKASPEAVETPESQLVKALDAHLPDALVEGEAKKQVIQTIVKGVLCSGEACWVKPDVEERGGDNDPLAVHVREELDKVIVTGKVSDKVRGWLVHELCDAVYETRDKGFGNSSLSV